jgi:DNA-binding HxlR family transcriptional regulator
MTSRPRPHESSSYAPPAPSVPLQNCPINASLGTLGRKWTLTILRDIAFYPGTNFSSILKTNPGLLQRTLSLRLRQLIAEGLVARSPSANGARRVHYDLTEKGREIWPILAGLIQFGVRNHPTTVFADGRSRDIEDVFPGSSELMLGHLAEFARSGGAVRGDPGTHGRTGSVRRSADR